MFSAEEIVIEKKARKFINQNKKLLVKKFLDPDFFIPEKNPVTYFMAGSPGAGKTEFSKRLIPTLQKRMNSKIARIDADDIREIIPGYSGKNSDIVHSAAILGLERLHDHALHNNISALIDGTLVNYEIAVSNINRSLKRNRTVQIFYIYQDPLRAWEYAKKREILEGRTIPKYVFINAYFKARSNILRLKRLFKNDILVFLIEKDYYNNISNVYTDIYNIDKYIKKSYSKKLLEKKLKDDIK